MGDKKPLRISTAFGPSLDQTLLMAVHPDEEFDGDEASSTRRTLILALQGDRAVFREEAPMPLTRAWYSAASGVAYIASVETNKLYKWKAGKWSDEVFTDAPVRFITYVFGIGADAPEDDQLFLCARDRLFIRSRAGWTNWKMPEDGLPFQVHGRSPTAVFIAAGNAIFQWDGQNLQEMAAPNRDNATALWVTQDDRLLAGDRNLSMLGANGRWAPMALPFRDVSSLMELSGEVYASVVERGVARVLPAPAALVTPPFEVDRLEFVGNGIVAVGSPFSMLTDGTCWQTIQVPECELGQRP